MPVSFFEEIKRKFPDIPIINYNWSSIKKDDFLPYRNLFSTVYSFDPEDCKNFDLKYVLERKIVPLLLAYFPYDVQLAEAVLKAADIACDIDAQTGKLFVRVEEK